MKVLLRNLSNPTGPVEFFIIGSSQFQQAKKLTVFDVFSSKIFQKQEEEKKMHLLRLCELNATNKTLALVNVLFWENKFGKVTNNHVI